MHFHQKTGRSSGPTFLKNLLLVYLVRLWLIYLFLPEPQPGVNILIY